MKPRISPSNFEDTQIPVMPSLTVEDDVIAWATELSRFINAERERRFSGDAKLIEKRDVVEILGRRRELAYWSWSQSTPGKSKKRPISVPAEDIREVQSGILDFLPAHLTHENSFAYEKGKSAILCARQHIGMQWGIKLDVTGFFHQIRESNVQDLFQCLGATEFSAKLYAKILTHLPSAKDGFKDLFGNGILPQGSPTSGAVSNLVCIQLDVELSEIAAKHGMVFTRYSDDILFSAKSSVYSKLSALRVLKEIRLCLNRFALNVNKKKTRIYSPNNSHQYLGLLIGESSVGLPKHFRRAIYNSARVLLKFGLEAVEKEYSRGNRILNAHKGKTRERSFTFLTRYLGQLSYVSQIEPKWSRDLAQSLYNVILSEPRTWDTYYTAEDKGAIQAVLARLTKA